MEPPVADEEPQRHPFQRADEEAEMLYYETHPLLNGVYYYFYHNMYHLI